MCGAETCHAKESTPVGMFETQRSRQMCPTCCTSLRCISHARTINQSNFQEINPAVIQSINPFVNHSINPSADLTMYPSANQCEPVNQSISIAGKQSIRQPVSRSISQSVKQPIRQAGRRINQKTTKITRNKNETNHKTEFYCTHQQTVPDTTSKK